MKHKKLFSFFKTVSERKCLIHEGRYVTSEKVVVKLKILNILLILYEICNCGTNLLPKIWDMFKYNSTTPSICI